MVRTRWTDTGYLWGKVLGSLEGVYESVRAERDTLRRKAVRWSPVLTERDRRE
jgi:hypothetical protein